jgi:predicted Zn-dependent protease
MFLLAMIALAIFAWFGRKSYKEATERKLVTQARRYLEKKDFPNAALCLQRALQLNPLSASASQSMGDMLDTLGVPAALSWRIHTAELQTNNLECRFAWAQTAVKMRDVDSATFALSGIDQQAATSATYHKLLGALDWEKNDYTGAESNYLEALRLEPTNQAVVLNLATVRLASTNEGIAAEARTSLERIPTTSNLRATAVRYLVDDAIVHKEWPNALRYSQEILDRPDAVFDDKIVRLQILRNAGRPDYASWLGALQAEAQKSPQEAYALGRWMTSVIGPTNAYQWLQSLPVTTQTNAPVPLIEADCLVAMKNWNGLLRLVEKPGWDQVDSYRFALESLARRSLGQDAAAQTAWRKALGECSQRLDRLTRMSQVTSLWGWKLERNDVLKEITAEFPREKWAVDELVAELYEQGNTIELGSVLSKVCDVDPSDAKIKNCLASVFLLRKTELERAYRLAGEAYSSSTNNPFFISTYAYSLLLQNKQDEALKVVNGIRPEYLQIPSISAYYGVIQAQSGHKDLAKGPLDRAQMAKLLPEEKEMVRMAKASL